MRILPTDLLSFAWGTVAGAVAAFASGFFKKAGEHAFASVHERMNPTPHAPIEVSRAFRPPATGADYVWVTEERLHELEQRGFAYYLDPETGARYFMREGGGRQFLMVRPGAHDR